VAGACLHSKTLIHNNTGALFLTRRVIGAYLWLSLGIVGRVVVAVV